MGGRPQLGDRIRPRSVNSKNQSFGGFSMISARRAMRADALGNALEATRGGFGRSILGRPLRRVRSKWARGLSSATDARLASLPEGV